MIFRLSQKLTDKIKVGKPGAMLLGENRLADWSAQLFAVGRTQHIKLSLLLIHDRRVDCLGC